MEQDQKWLDSQILDKATAMLRDLEELEALINKNRTRVYRHRSQALIKDVAENLESIRDVHTWAW